MIASAGLSQLFCEPPTLAAKRGMLDRCDAALHALGSEARATRYHVPGRIEVLGKHTDYCGGHSLVAATEQGFVAAASPRSDAIVRLIDVAQSREVRFELSPELSPPAGIWANYPMTVARRVARNFPGKLRGVDVAFLSDLPQAAGLSSSSALVVLSFLVLADANRLWEREEFTDNIRTLEDLAEYLGTNENGQTFRSLAGDRGVGTFGGSQDHTAILCCRAGELSLFKYCPVQHVQQVPMPADWTFVVASSGVVAEKTGAAMEKYNAVSRRAAEALQHWRNVTGRPDATLFDTFVTSPSFPDAEAMFIDALGVGSDSVLRRGHLMGEEVAIRLFAHALRNRDEPSLRLAADWSHDNAATILGNQTHETNALQRLANESGAIAASAFGAGFGGSVWAIVRRNEAEAVARQWRDAYRAQVPEAAGRAEFFTTTPGSGASRITSVSGDSV